MDEPDSPGGRILHDVINTIVLLLMRKEIKDLVLSTTAFGWMQSLMCARKNNGVVTVETPNKQVKQCYRGGNNGGIMVSTNKTP